MISMSGFGSGKGEAEGYRYLVECNSVNRKGLEIVIVLPRGLTSLEPRVREEVQKKIYRGRIHVAITSEQTTSATKTGSILDPTVVKKALKELEHLQKSLHISAPITLETLLLVPGVLRNEALEEIDLEAAWKPIQKALKKALESHQLRRAREGKNLVADLEKHILLLSKITKKIQTRVPTLFVNRRNQLLARLAELSVPISPDDPSLLRELIFFSERSDINEEVIRLQSHLVQCRELLTKRGEARTLDYLAQEMFREFNTLANKANDAEISRWVVQSKSEIDKIREQLANLE
jgi:uncharacterized protein (TIGR00255 family)